VYKKGPGAVAGRPWQFYQALRHFGGANMLFCDGHVETLQSDDVRVDNPAWYHKAK
jgi:prepilin-type processing-associated H-X9-DG protein